MPAQPRLRDAGTLTAAACTDGPLGLAALTHVERLPFLQPSVHARAFTSADRMNARGNEDSSQYLSQRDGENTLFEAMGPGLVTRFWRAHGEAPGGAYRFYLDGESEPSLVLPTDATWSSPSAPFTPPLTLNFLRSSGGDVTYLPLAFTRSLRVTDTRPPKLDYYQLDYYLLPERAVVSGLTTGPLVQRAEDVLTRVGADPKRPRLGERRDLQVDEGMLKEVEAGALVDVLSLAGPAQIDELWLEIDDTPASRQAFEQARLIIRWDGEREAAVDAPLAMFFAHGTGLGSRVRSLLVGNAPEGGRDTQFYAYFPMPFARSAELAIRAGDVPLRGLRWRVRHRPFDGDFERVGSFHAKHSVLAPAPFIEPLSLSGMAGTYVGLVFVPNADADLEGDPTFYLDGMASPVRVGTGTEDYFNGGWYYDQGSFSTPLHGATRAEDAPDGSRRLSQYRFHVNDPIPFSSAFRLRWAMAVGAQAVAYYYAQPTPLHFESDALDVGSSEDEQRHQYATTGSTRREQLEADLLGAPHADQGRSLDRGATATFVVSVDPDNAGVTLRRRFDVLAGAQRALVRVQGQPVGTWLSHPLDASDARWVEDEFYIPRAHSAGATSLTVSLSVESERWSEYAYQVFSQRPLPSDCP